MIARMWHGATKAEKSDEYYEFLQKTGLKDFAATPGNRGALVLRRIDEGKAHFTLISFWDSMDSIRKFAGDEPEKARYYSEDSEFLFELEPYVTHLEVVSAPALFGNGA